ncbi:MAG: endonuclease/exonuclease/phosphatase family protein [Candidatus Hydrogenedentales bacterium]
MHSLVKISLAFLIILLILFMGFILVLYFKNKQVAVSNEFQESVYLDGSVKPWEAPITLKIVTFNIQDLFVVGKNRPARMRHIGKVLTELDPDIVGFQESFLANDRKILLEALKDSRLSFHHYFSSGLVGSGLLICSAWPIQESFFHRYSEAAPAYRVWEGDYWAGKGAALARIETPAGMLDFYNTHAQADYKGVDYTALRQGQMAELAAFMNESRIPDVPALLVGDMNCRQGAVDHETVVKDVGLSRLMTIKSGIDHIYGGDAGRVVFEVVDTISIEAVIEEGGRRFELSDHPGFMSTLRIIPQEG